jgi:hypothetical protein
LSKLRPGRKDAESTTIHGISIPALCRDMAYSQRKDYGDVAIGFVRLRIKPGKREIKVDWQIGG